MKKRIILALVAAYALIQGCVVLTVHPLYTADTIVQNALINGNWESVDDDSVFWYFEAEKKRYSLVQDDGKKAKFDVHLVELDGIHYMDFYPEDLYKELEQGDDDKTGCTKGINEFLAWHAVPMHIFAKVEIEENEIRMWFFDPEFIEDLLEQRKIKIKHEKLEDGFLITASSEELQKFVIKYSHVEDAYLDTEPLAIQRIHS
jgi:hypothetical protein